jgi:hypothetical protein
MKFGYGSQEMRSEIRWENVLEEDYLVDREIDRKLISTWILGR